MIDLKAFRAGMERLGGAFNRPLTDEVLTIFAEILAPRLTTEQWAQAVTRALESETYFPPPAVLLRYGVSDRGLTAAAGDAYAKIVECYERGEVMGYRDVERRFGHAAAEAFIAAGAGRRFAWCEPDDEPFRLKDFRAAYVEQAEVDPISALPPGEAAGRRAEQPVKLTARSDGGFTRAIGGSK